MKLNSSKEVARTRSEISLKTSLLAILGTGQSGVFTLKHDRCIFYRITIPMPLT
jgi:hypothetical protein